LKFDIVIVGASTAGLHAARLLAEQGKSVSVYERRPNHNTERRTLIVTRALRKILGEIPEEVTLHQIEIMGVSSSQEETAIHLQDPDPIVERAAMTDLLTRKAVKAGAQIFYGRRFKGLREIPTENGGNAIDISFEHSRVGHPKQETARQTERVLATQAIIGADGVLSDVAVASNIARPPSVPLIQAECPLPTNWKPDDCRVWFDLDKTKYFYWLIPESSSVCVAGLIGEKGLPVRLLLDNFLGKMGLEPSGWQSSQVALHHPRLKPWSSIGDIPVYLIGDAAGQVKVTTVGGTVTGFEGAEAACRAILNNTSYRRELRTLKRELDLHWWIRWALEGLDNKGFDTLIRAMSKGSQSFLSRYDRDSMVPVFWKLIFVEPSLIPVGIRCLLGRISKGTQQSKNIQEDLPEDL